MAKRTNGQGAQAPEMKSTMKKLMIAAAAVAAVTGAYATEGCCGIDPTTAECKANVYQVKMTLKALVPKTIKKSGCEGLYFEQGTRTIDGYIWTCCDPCGTATDTQPYQITLWEKAAKVGILDGVGASSSGMYTVTVKYDLAGVKYTKVLEGTFAQADVDQAVTDFLATIPGATRDAVTATPVTVEKSHWADTLLESTLNGDTSLCRFSKTANKVAVQFEVAGNGAPASNPDVDAAKYQLVAAGFGTFDKKSRAIKSVSGNVVGTLPSLDHCDDYANVADLCDEFETWCDYADPGEMTVPAFGTWTAKYVKKMGILKSSVPVYNRQ